MQATNLQHKLCNLGFNILLAFDCGIHAEIAQSELDNAFSKSLKIANKRIIGPGVPVLSKDELAFLLT